MFGNGSPMFGSGAGLGQQRPPQVSTASTNQRYIVHDGLQPIIHENH